MATITKTPSNTWKAIIRKRGWPTTIKTFRTQRDAEDWVRKVDKQNVVVRPNEHYGIPYRRFVTHESKAQSVTREKLDKILDPHICMTLELQQAFGLRHKETITSSSRRTGPRVAGS